MPTTSLAGFAFGLSLIVAIGAQNSFVLRQSIRNERAAAIALVCVLSDLILIMIGISGIDWLIRQAPVAVALLRWGGAAFLLGYGALAARRALRRGAGTGLMVSVEDELPPPVGRGRRVIITAIALTWLNPHVYLDTVLLLGSVANQHGNPGRWWFGAGAMIASASWFVGLSVAGRLLRPLFARPVTWRVLDGLIAVIMISLAISLITRGV